MRGRAVREGEMCLESGRETFFLLLFRSLILFLGCLGFFFVPKKF